MTLRPTPLLVLVVLEAAAATALGAVVVAVMATGDGPIVGPLDPTAVGVLAVALSLLAGLVVLLCVSAAGLWRRRAWAVTTAGLVQALLVVGAGVGLVSLGWQPVLGLVSGIGVLGLGLVVGTVRRASR